MFCAGLFSTEALRLSKRSSTHIESGGRRRPRVRHLHGPRQRRDGRVHGDALRPHVPRDLSAAVDGPEDGVPRVPGGAAADAE